jgi:transcriptional regulator
MYVRSEYREEDQEKLLAFMREHSFATLVSYDGVKPVATHLPFVIKQDGDRMMLITHMALANQQKKSLGNGEVLVIFQGPHAYISPTNYEDKARVPTWNYIAVHAYGNARITTFDEHDHVLRTMINEFEPSYMSQYESLPEHYKVPNMKAIVCIEITVTRLEASYKLSQDKSADDRERVANSLSHRDDASAKEIAQHMKRDLPSSDGEA